MHKFTMSQKKTIRSKQQSQFKSCSKSERFLFQINDVLGQVEYFEEEIKVSP